MLKVLVMARETCRIRFIFAFSPLASASATSLEMATGSPSSVMVITRGTKGCAIMSSPIPSAPSTRAMYIPLMKPRIRLTNAAIDKTKVPLMKDCCCCVIGIMSSRRIKYFHSIRSWPQTCSQA
ncbi:hypothetical protein D3C75_741660 [compost metagenome]